MTIAISTGHAAELALSVATDLLKPDELDSFEVSPNPPPASRYPFENTSDLWLHVQVKGSFFDLPLTGDPSSDHLVARITSNLQDWIAESRYAWGEQRVTD